MDKFSLYVGQCLPFHEHFAPRGHRACQGCGVALAVRHVYKSLEGKCAWLEKALWQIPLKHSLFAQIEKKHPSTEPALLSIPKQKDGDDLLYICFDNECSEGKIEKEVLFKRLPAVAVASGFSYVATACPSHPFDLIEKTQRAWETKGHSYTHILCPCPVAWEYPAENTVRLGRMAVESRVFPLYEISSGSYHITVDDPNPRPVVDYVKRQKRFSHWSQQKIASFQTEADAQYTKLKDKAVVAN